MVLVFHLSILCDHSSMLILFSLFLGFALHNIHAFHARLFLLLFSKRKKGGKEKKNVFCVIFLGFEIKVGYIIFTEHVYVPSLAWMSLFYWTLLV